MLNRMLTLFEPIPVDNTDPTGQNIHEVTKHWETAETEAMERWLKEWAKLKGESEEGYLKAQEVLLETLTSKQKWSL